MAARLASIKQRCFCGELVTPFSLQTRINGVTLNPKKIVHVTQILSCVSLKQNEYVGSKPNDDILLTLSIVLFMLRLFLITVDDIWQTVNVKRLLDTQSRVNMELPETSPSIIS